MPENNTYDQVHCYDECVRQRSEERHAAIRPNYQYFAQKKLQLRKQEKKD